MPEQPEAFSEAVASMLRRARPDFDVALTGPRELIVNGRRLDLENLLRLVATDPQRGVEIVEQYLDHLFDDDSLSAAALPWELVKPKIMPRIQPESIFAHLSREQVAHVPYVNDTIVVFVIDMPHMTVSVTTEQMIKWGLALDDIESLARHNLARYTPQLEYRRLDSEEGGRALVLALQDGYDASRLLLDSLFPQLAPELGGDFLVACPSRDMFLALTPEPDPFVRRVRGRVEHDFTRLPYPITDRLFYVTRDGVAG
ncbi:MAG TPA: hypothetical protein DEB06_04660, partial [Phycisphaerales bacterium]|nr:hypothetical protein [Phycisphaerales bacterium]